MSVVDASVWVSRLVAQDVHHSATRRWFEQHTTAGGLLVAPVLLLAEVAGAIARRTGDAQLGNHAVRTLLRLRRLRLVALDRRLGEEAADLAANLVLRGVDAVYVATARRLGLTLVTWDIEQQTRAAGVISVQSP